MTRLLTILLLAAVVFGEAKPANAEWFTSALRGFRSDYHQSKDWYYQYSSQDRVTTEAPFEMMATNGWRRQNLLGEHHFDAETSELTKAGELKVYWIMTQPPEHRRTIFVQRDRNPMVTASRMAGVRQFTGDVAMSGLADIQETHIVAEGHPAEMIDSTNVRFIESQPPPVLPAVSSDSNN